MLRRFVLHLRQAKQKAPLNTPYIEKHTKHRSIMPLYDLWPSHGRAYIAPNATLIGEIYMGHECAVWSNAVLRGDINSITVMDYVFIGEHTVITTAASLPTGAPAGVVIGCNVIVGPRCSLHSCTIDDFVHVGAGSVILEGAKLEKGCAIGAGSVVPPGRLIPSNQLWAGNPVQFVRNLYEPDEISFKEKLTQEAVNAGWHTLQFQDFPHAHMYED